MTNNSERVLLKPCEVAQRLGIGRTKVYDLINEGVLPAVKLGPRCTRIPLAALAQWTLAPAHTVTSGPTA
jgi:excisionase family DNA binding protein